MKSRTLLNVAFNVRSAENGFIVEVAEHNGGSTWERMFRTFDEARVYVEAQMRGVYITHEQLLKHVESEASKSFPKKK